MNERFQLPERTDSTANPREKKSGFFGVLSEEPLTQNWFAQTFRLQLAQHCTEYLRGHVELLFVDILVFALFCRFH